MRIEFEEAIRAETTRARGLDMVPAADAFDDETLAVEDDRRDDGDVRYISISFPDCGD